MHMAQATFSRMKTAMLYRFCVKYLRGVVSINSRRESDVKSSKPGLPGRLAEKHDQVNVSRRVTEIREHRSCFCAMLGPVIDDMRHRLPQDFAQRSARGIPVIKGQVEPFFTHVAHKLHQPCFFCFP